MRQVYLIENIACEACNSLDQSGQSNQSNFNKILCPVTLESCGHMICTKCAIKNLHVKKNGTYHTGCPICKKISEIFISKYYSLGSRTTAQLYYDFIGFQTQTIYKSDMSQTISIVNKNIALEIKENYPNKPEFKYVYIGKCESSNLNEDNKFLSFQFSECYIFSEQSNIIYPCNPFNINYKINLQNNNVDFAIRVGCN